MEENRNEITLAKFEGEEAEFEANDTFVEITEDSTDPEGENGRNEREQYDDLIKNRFKDFYAEDTQRLINRRFRKYKIMEERFRILEETLAQKEAKIAESDAKIAEFDSLLRSETEKAIKETEERILNGIKAKKLRPDENGALPRHDSSQLDVTRLTKNQRATLAKRAASGEKIKF